MILGLQEKPKSWIASILMPLGRSIGIPALVSRSNFLGLTLIN